MALPCIRYKVTFTEKNGADIEENSFLFDHKILGFNADKWTPLKEGVSESDKALIIANQVNEASLQTLPPDLLQENSYALQLGKLLAKEVCKAEDVPLSPRIWAVILDVFQKFLKKPSSSLIGKSISVDLRLEDAKNKMAGFLYSKEQSGFVFSFNEKDFKCFSNLHSGFFLREGKLAFIKKGAKLEKLTYLDLEYVYNHQGTLANFIADVYASTPHKGVLEKAARFCIEAVKKRHKLKLVHGSFNENALFFEYPKGNHRPEETVFSCIGKCKPFSKEEEYQDIQNLVRVLNRIYEGVPSYKSVYNRYLIEIFTNISLVEKAFELFVKALN